ncbi:SPOR domain-containing protein [Aurantimonas sp. HBX-1]|uniref:SPOR domain-containing protein n=1 Tax=Aurantimonas sp. HBX-1 TaxID=2906072 RepID=UPI001F3F7ACA|nr:SPOR domain-containing protein [Aurantimonas sp. HBX-1]UIJ73582.1 SPOR domain-containing protein [Aurantimonas sp. HBX-1]
MGELTGGDRGIGMQADPFEDDPFAELARLIDAPEARRPAATPAQPSDDWQFGNADAAPDVSLDADFDLDMDAFAGALDEELSRDAPRAAPAVAAMPVAAAASATPKVAASYSNWISPAPRSPVATVSPTPAASQPAPVSPILADEDVSDPVLEAAFRGLSAPANPRDARFQESEAFAPARASGPDVSEPTAQLFDDFDALVASELAAMQAPPPASVESRGAATKAVAGSEPASSHDDAMPSAPEARQTASAARRQAVSGRRAGLAAVTAASSAGRQMPVSRRMMSVGASLAVIALVGGAGVYMLTGDGGTVYDAPLIVKADAEPVKVAPKDPGGRAVPNQNKAVYERVQGAGAVVEPSQQTLLTAAEEPADLPQTEPELSDLPGVDLNPIGAAIAAEPTRTAEAGADNSPIAVLTPRRVRTLTVNPDGTLVATEEVPSTSLAELRGENPALIEAASRPLDSLSTGTTAQQPAADAAAPVAEAPDMATAPAATPAAPVQVAAAAPAEPQAVPAAEPATEVAALAPATPPVVEGGYYVQISSQPSREAAEESSRTLGQRFAEVIGGRSLVIQSADIPGKGTYHRVRVAAASKSEANDLCQRLKSAGGSCFVSR